MSRLEDQLSERKHTYPNRKIYLALGGGSALPPLIEAITAADPDAYIIVFVPSTDRGGSTGILLDANGSSLPPGDAGKALWALSGSPQLRDFLSFRFPSRYNGLSGHSLSNLVLSVATEQSDGNPDEALWYLAELFNISQKGRVLYATHHRGSELAVKRGWQITRGEKEIDEHRDRDAPPISAVWLDPPAPVNPDVEISLRYADEVYISASSFYTSTCPILLPQGFADAWHQSSARKIIFTNLVNESGHTTGWNAFDYVNNTLMRLHEQNPAARIDMALINDPAGISPQIIERYEEEGEEITQVGEPPADLTYQYQIHDLTSDVVKTADPNDPVANRSTIRHDPEKMAVVLKDLNRMKLR